MSSSTTRIEKKTLDQAELVRQLKSLDKRLELLEQAIADKLNESYQQGVADERKARTGRDPKVGDDG
jgi:hypothetical protein